MPVTQMILTIIVEKSAVKENGEPYNYYQVIDVDLAKDDVSDFLARLGDDVNENSSMMLAVRRNDGEYVSFTDGMAATSQGYGWEPLKRISEINDGDYADKMRYTARVFAERRLARTE